MIINVIKYIGIFLSYTDAFSGQFDFFNTTIAIISLVFFFINFLALFLIMTKEFVTKLHKFVLSFFLYLVYQNTFFYMVKIYLICNYHDVSWGSRAKDSLKGTKISRRYKFSTIGILFLWLLFNGI